MGNGFNLSDFVYAVEKSIGSQGASLQQSILLERGFFLYCFQVLFARTLNVLFLTLSCILISEDISDG